MNKYILFILLLSTSIFVSACTSTDYIIINREGGGSLSGNNETGYSIHACGDTDICTTGYYSIAS